MMIQTTMTRTTTAFSGAMSEHGASQSRTRRIFPPSASRPRREQLSLGLATL